MSKASITIEGFVANDLEMKDVNGHRVVKVSVPHTPRKLNKQTNQWEDAGETAWFSASFWDEQADAILGAVAKRQLVTVTGQPTPRGYQKQDGTIAVDTELKFATLGVIPRADTSRQVSQSAPAAPTAQETADAWSTPAAQDVAAQWAGNTITSTPF